MIGFLAALAISGQTDARMGGAYREDRAGWACVHLKGAPRDIGFQYGELLASEIDDVQKALHDSLKRKTGQDWGYYRDTAKKLFWGKLDPEYQQEIEGQAEGLKARGLPYDQWDVLALNGYIELSMYYLPWTQHQPARNEACSAFIATGSETSDGKIVIGQNLWWDLQMGERFNAMLDITPEKGHRILMDALPGFIHSGTDFAVNDAGIMLTETTLPILNDFDPNGVPEFERMRKAIQYSESLPDFVRIMKAGNNGGYANTWLVGDRKTNAIGKLELGLKNVTWTSTKDGYFVGSNFPENPKLISEEMAGWDTDPRRNGCEARRQRWTTLLTKDKGQVDPNLAKGFLADTVNPITGDIGASDFTLCGRIPDFGATNAKVITSDLAGSMSFWGRMGAPDGVPFAVTESLPYEHDLAPQAWVLLKADR